MASRSLARDRQSRADSEAFDLTSIRGHFARAILEQQVDLFTLAPVVKESRFGGGPFGVLCHLHGNEILESHAGYPIVTQKPVFVGSEQMQKQGAQGRL